MPAALEAQGGARLIRQSELDAEKLATLLKAFMEEPEKTRGDGKERKKCRTSGCHALAWRSGYRYCEREIAI